MNENNDVENMLNNYTMNKTVNLDIPNADVRARRNIILNLLEELNKHNNTTMQTVDAIDHLIRAELFCFSKR